VDVLCKSNAIVFGNDYLNLMAVKLSLHRGRGRE